MGSLFTKNIEPDYSIFFKNQPEYERFDDTKFLSVGSNKFRTVSWFPENSPKAIVIVSHGLHEHALRYYDVAHSLTARGYGVYGIDHYAHGLSSGKRGLIVDHTILTETFVKFVEWVHSRHPNLVCYILAHSMGTMITITALKKITTVSAVVLSGVPLVSGPGVSSPFGIKLLYPLSQTSFAKTLTYIMSSIDPNGAAAPIFEDALTSNATALDELHKDPYHYSGSIKNKTAYELLKMNDVVEADVSGIEIPFLLLHGTADTISYPRGATYVMEHAKTPADKKKLIMLEGYKHEIFFEGE